MTTDQTDYIASINDVLIKYNDKYCQRVIIGSRKDREWTDIKYIWANIIRDILEEYFSTDYAVDSNFFPAYYAEKLMQDFAAITNSSYFLKLADDTKPVVVCPVEIDTITGNQVTPFYNTYDFTNYPNDTSEWDNNKD